MIFRDLCFVFAMGIIHPAAGQSDKVIVTSFDSILLCHSVVPAGPVPSAIDPDGVYPYPGYCETSARPGPVNFHFITIENQFLKVTICPDRGGMVTSLVHKPSNREVLYCPGVIRHTRILPRFNFVAGGIETSFPISHSPSQNEKVLFRIERSDGRTYVTCGERELRFGMQWSVEYSLGPDDPFLTQRMRFFNPGTQAYPWMSWSNAAVPSAPDTQFHFPGGPVLSHSSQMDTIDWQSQGPWREEDIREMTGYFWLDPDANAFGVFTPSLGTGLYHVADRSDAPGMKLWSYGSGEDRAWATLSTSANQPYLEIQGGPIRDQSVKLELQPDHSLVHTEFWIPVDRPLQINSLNLPEVALRSESHIPLFSWARQEMTGPWLGLMKAFRSDSVPPELPPLNIPCWPPSGMEELGEAFKWAILSGKTENRDTWYYYYGTWLAGRGEEEQAAAMLALSGAGLARALLARLMAAKGIPGEAAEEYRSIRETWVRDHPQVVVERDRALRELGPGTLRERKECLDRVEMLEDEWIIERRVQLLIDQGNPTAAKDLLLSTDFQKVHQRYNRTDLWRQICELLNEPFYPIPIKLGEDRLARFGAYREFE